MNDLEIALRAVDEVVERIERAVAAVDWDELRRLSIRNLFIAFIAQVLRPAATGSVAAVPGRGGHHPPRRFRSLRLTSLTLAANAPPAVGSHRVTPSQASVPRLS
ncbi:hypothetical protein RB608_22740 [Nocardioides sp. LHD-245]|uniref:hypothetical protein n=1 Tax=Nocardioides sp. LHD-245 TaxID=3051387 RepID=UPI0027DF2689|nr:hypothetical protein [Nocardioides sp. LHD-245]